MEPARKEITSGNRSLRKHLRSFCPEDPAVPGRGLSRIKSQVYLDPCLPGSVAQGAPGSGSPGLCCRPLLVQMAVPGGLSHGDGEGGSVCTAQECVSPGVQGRTAQGSTCCLAQSPDSEPSCSHAVVISISKSPYVFSFTLLNFLFPHLR